MSESSICPEAQETPERVWIDLNDPDYEYYGQSFEGGTEFVRADIATRAASLPVEAAEKLKLTRDNGSWIPEVIEQVLIPNSCGVPGHFVFQNNGGHCLMCQRESRLQAEAREKAIHEQPDYRAGIDDALRIAIPIAKCSCADKIVDELRRHRANVIAAPAPSQPSVEAPTTKLATREDAERFIRDHLASAEWKGERLMITFAKEDLIHALVEQWTFPLEPEASPDAEEKAREIVEWWASDDQLYECGCESTMCQHVTEKLKSRIAAALSGKEQ